MTGPGFDLRELLPLFALGLLDADEEDAVRRAIGADPALLDELRAYQAVADELGPIGADSPPPSAAVRSRLLASIEPGPYQRFAARMAAIFDVAASRASDLLGWIDDPARWEAMVPGVRLIHFPAGPACTGADTGFVSVAPGTTFPWHQHDGEEHVLVLDGAADDASGRRLEVGDEVVMAAGSAHDFTALPGRPFVYAVRVFGVRFDVDKPVG